MMYCLKLTSIDHTFFFTGCTVLVGCTFSKLSNAFGQKYNRSCSTILSVQELHQQQFDCRVWLVNMVHEW